MNKRKNRTRKGMGWAAASPKMFPVGSVCPTIPKSNLILTLAALVLCGQASADNTRQYHIPAQSLNNALLKFSADSGVEILFAADKVRGLNGSMSTSQALSQLLQGSGMSYRFVDAKTVTVEQAPTSNSSEPQSSGVTTLPTVTVEADAGNPYNNPYNKSYTIRNSTTATKTDTPIFDTPVTVQVLSKAVMNSQQAVRAYDALQNVSGVFAGAFSGVTYDPFIIRGFDVGNRHYRDGLRMPAHAQSLAGIQQIEVLKGPAAMLYGRLQPGGLINFVSRQPLATPYYSLQQQFGSYDLYRTTVDATGPIDSEGKLLYRANLEYTDQNSFIDFVSNERIAVEPSFTWHISDATQLDFNFRFNRKEEAPFTWGVPVIGTRPAPVRLSTYTGEPSDNSINSSYYSRGEPESSIQR
jgi:iron complex outermembrane receptor protein